MNEQNMDAVMEKAQVLIEALPYIQRFNRKIIVVKYGGSAMVDEELKEHVIQDVTLLKLVGFKPIIVHGGGKEISKWVAKAGMEPEFINGLRKTDEPTMEIAEMVLNRVNKSLVKMVQELGVRSVGISGKDGGLLKVDKKLSNGQDIGFVGEVKEVNPKILYDLLENDYLPIICPIGMDDNYDTYNINADDAACAIARAVSAEKLAFLTDIEGVYKDPEDKSTLISELTVSEARKLITDGFIGGGMLPKLNNCIDAIENGVSRVHILDGRIAHCLLLEIFTNKGIGTAILGDGEGVHLYDTDGKEYLDFAAGIAVCALGYGNKEYNDALKAQIDKLLHTSNLYYNVPTIEAAKKALAASQMDRIFFTNSGTEAIEGAIKAAKKYAYTRDGHAGHEIIAMKHSFHGRSIGALSVTGNAHYQEPFEPLMPGVKFAEFNNLESVKELVTDKTCAILMETIQGEGGIYPAEQAFIEGVRKLCDEKDILLILDEIQCGMGRSGKMFAWQNYGVKPDIMTCAKALGCGVPVGAFFMTQKVADKSLAPGDHGTTYGGNPFVGAAVSTVFDLFEKQNVLDNVNAVAPYLEQKLDELVAKYDFLTARRGKGLMQGLVCTLPVGQVSAKALEQGLIVITAGADVLRFVPPLVIEKQHVDEMIEKLEKALLAVKEA